MERLIPRPIKLEKESLPETEVKEKAKAIFEPFGEAKEDKYGFVEIENEQIRLKMRRSEVRFLTKRMPKTPDELYEPETPNHERVIIETMGLQPELFYELSDFSLESKDGQEKIVLDEILPIEARIFVRRNGKDIYGSVAYPRYSFANLACEPDTVAGLATLFHEVGHLKDPYIKGEKIDATIAATEDLQERNKREIMRRERHAWAFSLDKLRGFLSRLGTDQADLDALIHKLSLGCYSDFIRGLESQEDNKN